MKTFSNSQYKKSDQNMPLAQMSGVVDALDDLNEAVDEVTETVEDLTETVEAIPDIPTPEVGDADKFVKVNVDDSGETPVISYTLDRAAIVRKANISKSSNRDFEVSEGFRGFVIFNGAGTNQRGCYIMYKVNTTTFYQTPVKSASDMTITYNTTTGILNIANGNSSAAVYIMFIVMNGDITYYTPPTT